MHVSSTRGLSVSRRVCQPRILVVAEHDGHKLNAATLHAIQAAHTINAKAKTSTEQRVDVLLLAGGATAANSVAAHAAAVPGIHHVYVAADAALEHPVAEQVAAVVEERQKAEAYTHVLTAATAFGKNLLPRLAASFDVQPISDVLVVHSEDTFTRPIYAGNALQTVQSIDAIKLITVRATAFPKAAVSGGHAKIETQAAVSAPAVAATWESAQVAASERPELTSARVVISGGRGLQNGDNFQMLYNLADKIGTGRDAAVGASRAAVDAGFVPNDMQVGQTGTYYAPTSISLPAASKGADPAAV